MKQPLRVLCASAIDPNSEDHVRYKPLWPAYLSAYLAAHLGKERAALHYFSGDLSADIRRLQPDILALSSVTQNYGIARDMARTARSAGIPVVIGGMHISSLPRSLSRDMTVAVRGEGEETFRELVQSYTEHGSFVPARLADIPGLAYFDDGELHVTPERPLIPCLDDVPHPDRAMIGYGRERDYLYTARGCPYNCLFCGSHAHWKHVRYSSAPYVMEEIVELAGHGVKTIRFNDDNFPANAERLSEISRLVVEAGLHRKVRFSCWARANDITEEVVHAMKAMNIVAVVMGLESGNDRVLARLKGKATVAQNTRAVDLLRDARIQASADFIIGSPDETEEEIMDTFRFIRDSRLDFVTVNVFSPLPGTPVWKLAERRGLVSDTMDFGTCSFKLGSDPASAIVLSEKLSYEQLSGLYRKVRRLASVRTLRALPRSPWARELPRLAARKIAGKIRGKLRRAQG
jgi:anaerobic magnesium-protoporphyrin IX monomethyl ester cyclase